MKLFVGVFALMISSYAMASQSQTINCHQVNKNGSETVNGGSIKLSVVFTAGGKVSKEDTIITIKGFARKRGDNAFGPLAIRSVNEGTAANGREFTTLFLDGDDTKMLDVQLQFDAIVLHEKFRDVLGSFVIGSEDANPETGFSFGYSVSCSSR